ncbi:Monoamine oxidase N [Colletotrichum sp. SAR 10_86]|nr:Monoamine oxidase N [Colletotrichum sp. SAR 10_86]
MPNADMFGRSPELSEEWDKMSCQDRLKQIQDRLSLEERSMLEALLKQMGGTSLDKMGLLNALRWWVLGSHNPTGLNDIALHTRLRSGNGTLHRRMFEHAVSSGNLSYSFNSAVSKVVDTGEYVTVFSKNGQSWKTKSVIATVPLNVLADIEFSPALPTAKVEASRQGQVNLCNKLHVDLDGPDYKSWTSFASPGRGLVAHDWVNDEFAKGTWCYMAPEFTQKYVAALQKPHGNILFASGDYSEGWRGWIDGAVQAGMEAAHTVIQLQRKNLKENGGKNVNGINNTKI